MKCEFCDYETENKFKLNGHRAHHLMKKRKFPAPDFFLNTAYRNEGESQGNWKARMVTEHKIDYLFDDFSYGDPKMKEEFTAVHEAKGFHVPFKEISIPARNNGFYLSIFCAIV